MNKFFEQLSGIQIQRTLLIALGLTVFYWFTLYDDGSNLDAQIQQVSQQIQEEEQKKADTDATLRQVEEMQRKIGELSTKYQEIAKRLPSALFSIDINRAIDDFAKTAGVSIKSKKPAEPVKRELVEEVPVEVIVEGSFAQLAQFTFLISSSERMSRITNLVLSNTEEGSKKLKLQGNVIGYKLAPEPPKPPPEEIPGASGETTPPQQGPTQ